MDHGSDTYWARIPTDRQDRFIWAIWLVTWLGLLAGLVDRVYYEYVVALSAAHAVLFLVLFKFRALEFPVQVRIAYFLWVAVGTYVPYMVILMYITTLGLAANLFFGYCPLARMLYLLPWNRDESFTGDLVVRTFLTPPVKGKFRPLEKKGTEGI